MVPKVDDDGIAGLAGALKNGKEIADQGVHSAEAIVIVGDHFPHGRVVQSHVGHGFDLVTGLRICRQTVDLANPGVVRVGVIDAEEEGRITSVDKGIRVFRIISEILPGEISVRDVVDIKGKSGSRIYVELANEPRAIPRGLKALG